MDGSKVDFVAWATGEPNFANDDENCVTMYTNSGRSYTDLIESALGCDVCHFLHLQAKSSKQYTFIGKGQRHQILFV
jgi:hypothetical protein